MSEPVPTTTEVTVVCPRCAQVETLPLTRVDVSTDGYDLSDGTYIVRSLRADIVGDGSHKCLEMK